MNLPPRFKLVPPRVQLLLPPGARGAAEVQRDGNTPVRLAPIRDERRGPLRVRTLTADAQTYSPMVIEHVELHEQGAQYTLPLPEGWTCIVYVRRGSVQIGGGETASDVRTFETCYLERAGGDCLAVSNAGRRSADVLVLAGEPIGAPTVASGTMVMNSQAEVQQAVSDYQRGSFGIPWEHTLDDDTWAAACDARSGR